MNILYLRSLSHMHSEAMLCEQNICIQLFRERLSPKKCTRQSRKVIWDMIITLYLTTVAVEPAFFAFL